jgi:hypothetical protein
MEVQPCACIPEQYFVFVAVSVMPGSIPVQMVHWSEIKTRFKYNVGILVEGHWCDYSIVCEECSLTYQPVEVHITLRIRLPLHANLISLWLIVDYV